MNLIPDAPDIANTLRTGYPAPPPEYPCCPMCGRQSETFVVDRQTREIVGCWDCLLEVSADDYTDDYDY